MPNPNVWETEFLAACADLEQCQLGLNGSAWAAQLDLWELRNRANERIRPFVIIHARGLRSAFLKSPGDGVVNVNIQGDNNNFQQGANFSQVGEKVASNPPGLPPKADPGTSGLSLASFVASGIAAALVVWWCLPAEWSLGSTRFLVTVGIVTAATVLTFFSWRHHHRQRWEKVTYISLGAILIGRGALPSITGWFVGGAAADQEKAIAHVNAYLGSSDDIALPIASLVGGVFLLVLARFTKAR